MNDTPTEGMNRPHTMDLPSYDGTEPYLFVSYSHSDMADVRRVLQAIDREKFRFWYDDTMEIGEDFRAELRTKIENSSGILLFISDASMASKYCGMEIIIAYKNDKKIFPVYLRDDVEIPAPLKMILENLQHVTGFGSAHSDKYIAKLISGLPTETMRSFQTEGPTLVRCKDGSEALTLPSEIVTVGAGAFKNCERLRVLHLGPTVEVLEKEALRGCKSLLALTLPQNVRKVGESAFRDCISLTSLHVENEEIELGERAFENCALLSEVSLPDGLTEIYGGVFNSCKSLAAIKLPARLTVLGESSFADCVMLEEIDVPEHVTKVDDMAFSGCIELKRVRLRNRVTKIGKNAFKDCKSLESIRLPASVSFIGTGPFRGCEKLKSLRVDPKNKYYKSEPNKREGSDHVLFNKNKSVIIAYPASSREVQYDIPDSVTVISDWAFCECKKLNRITIPDSVYEIGEGAFSNCALLDEIEVPDSVVKIDDCAFRGCESLEKVIIPDSVKELGWGVFDGCENTVTVYCDEGSLVQEYCRKNGIREERIPTEEVN